MSNYFKYIAPTDSLDSGSTREKEIAYRNALVHGSTGYHAIRRDTGYRFVYYRVPGTTNDFKAVKYVTGSTDSRSKKSVQVGQRDLKLESRNHLTSEWVCFHTASDYILMVGNGSGRIEKSVNGGMSWTTLYTTTKPTRFSGVSLNAGDQIRAKDTNGNSLPVYCINGKRDDRIVPKSFKTRETGYYSNRYGGSKINIYSERGCTVNVYESTDTNAAKPSTATYSTTLSARSKTIITTSQEKAYYWIESRDGEFIASVVESGGGDGLMLWPSDHIVYTRRSSYRALQRGGQTNIQVTANRVYSNSGDFDKVFATAIGDGSGGDAEGAVGIRYLATDFLYSQNLSDIAYIAPFFQTRVRLEAFVNNQWNLVHTANLNAATNPTTPAYIQLYGDSSGLILTTTSYRSGGDNYIRDLGYGTQPNMWRITADKPISVVVNHPSNDEEALPGFVGSGNLLADWFRTESELDTYLTLFHQDWIEF